MRTGRCWPAESQSREVLILGSRRIGHRRNEHRHRPDGVESAVKNNQADGLHILLQRQVFNEAAVLLQRFVAVLITVLNVERNPGPRAGFTPGTYPTIASRRCPLCTSPS